jgi:hypothetical protein
VLSYKNLNLSTDELGAAHFADVLDDSGKFVPQLEKS